MIHTIISFIEKIVIPFGPFGVFFAEIIEEVIVPIPSAMVLFTAGFVLLKGDLSLSLIKDLIFVITLPASLGLTLGSLVIYSLGFYGGKPFIEKYGKFIDVSWQGVLDFDEKLNNSKYDELLFVMARIIPIVPSSLLAIFGGVTRMPVRKYIILTFLGSLLKALIYGFVGYKVGDLYSVYAEKVASLEGVGLKVVVAVFISFVGYKIYKKYKK